MSTAATPGPSRTVPTRTTLDFLPLSDPWLADPCELDWLLLLDWLDEDGLKSSKSLSSSSAALSLRAQRSPLLRDKSEAFYCTLRVAANASKTH